MNIYQPLRTLPSISIPRLPTRGSPTFENILIVAVTISLQIMHMLLGILAVGHLPNINPLAFGDNAVDSGLDFAPKDCKVICQPVTMLTDRCRRTTSDDQAQLSCLCMNKSFDVGKIAGLCAGCLNQVLGEEVIGGASDDSSEIGDDGDITDNETDDDEGIEDDFERFLEGT